MSTTEDPSSKPFRFMDFPAELRNKVYRLCAPKNDRVAIAGYDRSEEVTKAEEEGDIFYELPLALRPRTEHDNCLAILGVSKQVRSEASSMIFESVTPFIGLAKKYTKTASGPALMPSVLLRGLLANIKCLEIQVDSDVVEAQAFLLEVLPQQVEALKVHFAEKRNIAFSPDWAYYLVKLLLHSYTPTRQHQPRLLLKRYLSARQSNLLSTPDESWTVTARIIRQRTARQRPLNNDGQWPPQLRTITLVVPASDLESAPTPASFLSDCALRLEALEEDWIKHLDQACLIRHLQEYRPAADAGSQVAPARPVCQKFFEPKQTAFYRKGGSEGVDEIMIKQVIRTFEGGSKLTRIEARSLREHTDRVRRLVDRFVSWK